jgi:hypothetical protein
MFEELPQDEIDQLLQALGGKGSVTNAFENIEAFEEYLINRKYESEKPYGIFDKDIAVCNFFDTKDNESILEEIRQKNEDQGFGNIKIPNTNIMLINYSFCPKCKTIYSFSEIMDYYRNPNPDVRYKNRAWQVRKDTRIYCSACNTCFLPALVIADGTPKNEVQFLCRTQTIDAIEEYFLQNNVRVLTRRRENIIQEGNLRAIKNDVLLKNLEEKPTLISNMLQYTPINLMKNLIDGTNVEKGDLLFTAMEII